MLHCRPLCWKWCFAVSLRLWVGVTLGFIAGWCVRGDGNNNKAWGIGRQGIRRRHRQDHSHVASGGDQGHGGGHVLLLFLAHVVAEQHRDKQYCSCGDKHGEIAHCHFCSAVCVVMLNAWGLECLLGSERELKKVRLLLEAKKGRWMGLYFLHRFIFQLVVPYIPHPQQQCSPQVLLLFLLMR